MNLLLRLKNLKGNNTGLITLLIPDRTDLKKVRTKIVSEIQTASNIKDKINRTNVISSLKRINEKLKPLKQIPPKGLAIFSGSYL